MWKTRLDTLNIKFTYKDILIEYDVIWYKIGFNSAQKLAQAYPPNSYTVFIVSRVNMRSIMMIALDLLNVLKIKPP